MNTKQIFNSKEILKKRKPGDAILVAEVMNVSEDNARKILQRPNSKRHNQAISILNKIISDREQSVETAKKLQEQE